MRLYADKNMKRYIVLFQYGCSPTGEFVYSVVNALNKHKGLVLAIKRYGNMNVSRVVYRSQFEKSNLIPLGIKFYEEF